MSALSKHQCNSYATCSQLTEREWIAYICQFLCLSSACQLNTLNLSDATRYFRHMTGFTQWHKQEVTMNTVCCHLFPCKNSSRTVPDLVQVATYELIVPSWLSVQFWSCICLCQAVAVDILNKQPRPAEKGWSCSLAVARKGNKKSRPWKRNSVLRNVAQGLRRGRFFWNEISNEKWTSYSEHGMSGDSIAHVFFGNA
jgi:hypothetical protein